MAFNVGMSDKARTKIHKYYEDPDFWIETRQITSQERRQFATKATKRGKVDTDHYTALLLRAGLIRHGKIADQETGEELNLKSMEVFNLLPANLSDFITECIIDGESSYEFDTDDIERDEEADPLE